MNTKSAVQNEDEEERIEVKENGDAEMNLITPPTMNLMIVGTSQNHTSLEMDEHSAL